MSHLKTDITLILESYFLTSLKKKKKNSTVEYFELKQGMWGLI